MQTHFPQQGLAMPQRLSTFSGQAGPHDGTNTHHAPQYPTTQLQNRDAQDVSLHRHPMMGRPQSLTAPLPLQGRQGSISGLNRSAGAFTHQNTVGTYLARDPAFESAAMHGSEAVFVQHIQHMENLVEGLQNTIADLLASNARLEARIALLEGNFAGLQASASTQRIQSKSHVKPKNITNKHPTVRVSITS